jgi:hypothetical protein
MRNYALAGFLWLLVACGVTAPAITAQQVVDRFGAAGIELTDTKPMQHDPSSPVPNSWQERIQFNDRLLGDHGGQVFICDSKRNCDAIYAYFNALQALAGPYLYQSPSGLVVAQINSGFTPEQAKRYEDVVKALP